MIFGKLVLHETLLETKNDFYQLDGIRVVSVRRPFLSAGLMVGALLAAFSASFWGLLYDGERWAITLAILFMAVGGWTIGQLQLISRELRGMPQSEAVFGSYRRLRKESTKIAAAADAARKVGAAKAEGMQ